MNVTHSQQKTQGGIDAKNARSTGRALYVTHQLCYNVAV